MGTKKPSAVTLASGELGYYEGVLKTCAMNFAAAGDQGPTWWDKLRRAARRYEAARQKLKALKKRRR